VSTTAIPDRFTALPDEAALQATVTALEEHGFSAEVVNDLDAARRAVLARIPQGASVMTNTSVTLDQTGIADAVNDGAGRWESAPTDSTARSGRSWRSTRSCPAASTSSSSASRSATELPSQPDLPAGARRWP
jgi:hypothetical protein